MSPYVRPSLTEGARKGISTITFNTRGFVAKLCFMFLLRQGTLYLFASNLGGFAHRGMFCHRTILVSCFLFLVFDILFAVKTCYHEQTVSLKLLIANDMR